MANPMFTRRHYQAIAAEIARQTIPDVDGVMILSAEALNIVFDLSQMFSQDNPNFNHASFLNACHGR